MEHRKTLELLGSYYLLNEDGYFLINPKRKLVKEIRKEHFELVETIIEISEVFKSKHWGRKI